MATAELSLPDLDTIRPLILKGLDFAADVATLTPTTLDDQAVAGAIGIVKGAMFGIAWNFVRRRLERLPEAPEAAEDLASLQSAAPEGVPILAILAAIEMAWKLIQFLRR